MIFERKELHVGSPIQYEIWATLNDLHNFVIFSFSK
jgi:hypothetical protein